MKKTMYLWKKVVPDETTVEYIYLNENCNRIYGHIVTENHSKMNMGHVIYMGKAVKHVGTQGNKYLKSNHE
tara:strand:- start:965 stop:1177 length:213 start_codon:yes stop_codon:yes gene_type:complete